MHESTPFVFGLGIGLLELVAGGCLFWVGVRARQGKLRRNRWSGYRTQITMRSDGHWNAAHKAGANYLLLAAVPLWAAGLIILSRPPLGVTATASVTGVIGMGVFALIGARKATRAAAAYDAGTTRA
jgi:SdpI/YfhL protein family